MDNFKGFVKQYLQIILFALCGLTLIGGICVFVFGSGGANEFLNAMFILFGITLILLSISLAVMAIVVGSAEKANFFLYDTKTRSNLPVEELNFDMINKKMTFAMTKLTTSASKVWTENVFETENEVFGDDSYLPLVAYKILYDLSERSNEGIWSLYLMASEEIIDSIAAALEANQDTELAKAFKFLHSNANGSYERTEKFLADNKKYIQAKMVKYVKTNIDKF